MGTSLTGLTPATTYDALIKVGDNGPIDATLKTLSDGLGNDLPMEASTTGINFTGTTTVGGVAVANTTQVAAKQDTLVSGTNIKTINGTSVLGSGNIVTPTTSPSGVSGAIQFSNGSAFASDATNLFWDDTNNRLGVGTNAPDSKFQVVTGGSTGFRIDIGGTGNGNNYIDAGSSNTGFTYLRCRTETSGPLAVNFVNGYAFAMLAVKGSGSTSATTSLLVQNSSGTTNFSVRDDGQIVMGDNTTFGRFYTNNSGASFPPYSFNGNSQMGMFNAGANILGFGTANTERMRISNGGIGVNTLASNNASAIFQVDSTTQGFLPPRMTTTQKNAIATPAAGLVVYDSTMNATCEYNGTAWRVVSAGAQSVAASTATTTVDMSAGNVQNITLTASTTLTLSSAAVGTYILKLIQGGSGSYTVTWPGTVIWSGGTAPTLTTTVGKVDIVTLVFDGTNYYGNYSLNY